MTVSEDLTIFLAQAQRCYNELEQSLMPITEAIGDLEQDWTPRLPEFWERITTSVTLIRQAVSACLALFQEPSAQHASLALLISVASIEQSCYLHYLKSRVDEVGIRLTAYQHRSSLAQKYLRQRQGVLQALCELDLAGQEALIKGRTWLDQILHSQDAPRVPSPRTARPTARKTTSVSRRGTPTTIRTRTRPALRLVDNQTIEEDSSDTVGSG